MIAENTTNLDKLNLEEVAVENVAPVLLSESDVYERNEKMAKVGSLAFLIAMWLMSGSLALAFSSAIFAYVVSVLPGSVKILIEEDNRGEIFSMMYAGLCAILGSLALILHTTL